MAPPSNSSTSHGSETASYVWGSLTAVRSANGVAQRVARPDPLELRKLG
jgi:hypothetical protein